MPKIAREVAAVVVKEFLHEIRSPAGVISQFALVVIFVSAAFVVHRQRTPDVSVVAAIFWLIYYAVSCGNQLNAFSGEKDNGTAGFWRQIFSPTGYLCGKMTYNVVKNYFFGVVISLASVTLFYGGGFAASAVFGFTAVIAVAFAAGMTFPAVLCAGAAGKNGLFPFVAFPIVLPVIMVGNDMFCELLATSGMTTNFPFEETVFLLAYSGVIAGISLIVYPLISRYPDE